ncbi:hypothetical protein PUH89_13635 [Rhodobacter capsulatus]|uniref:Uncharacterized protein n=1 Tax=Rhodobacter capsulatus TaxID=1061 RepID=A0A1G7P359_RHOCA|nr:hypothetical protein [Rhodobacter capsulatus]WER08353.1 hypothetical protein PUH89_13635 [Rhodobacter capsulatus]SDF80752.1 hypothetical protein SAMN04244550_02893 [Rhodobacter capsulatus]
MRPLVIWATGLLAVFAVIVGQLVLPFAFDFLSTLGIYGIGVWAGAEMRKKAS